MQWFAIILVYGYGGWLCEVVVAVGFVKISGGVGVSGGDCVVTCARRLECAGGLFL